MTDEEFLAEMLEKFPKHVKVGDVTGCVRLTGPALSALRQDVYDRDKGTCQICRQHVRDGFPEYQKYDLAHIKSRGSGGSDLPSNCRTLCHRCHMKEHSGKIDRKLAAKPR